MALRSELGQPLDKAFLCLMPSTNDGKLTFEFILAALLGSKRLQIGKKAERRS